LHGVVFDILAARTFEGEFSNVTRSSAGKATVRYERRGTSSLTHTQKRQLSPSWESY
jgi:hypothetical protein